MPTIAATIRQARQSRGWSQYKLAARISVTGSAVYLWESAQRTPRPRYAAALEGALDLPAGSLLNEDGPQRKSVEGQKTTTTATAPTINGRY